MLDILVPIPSTLQTVVFYSTQPMAQECSCTVSFHQVVPLHQSRPHLEKGLETGKALLSFHHWDCNRRTRHAVWGDSLAQDPLDN